MTNKQLLVLNAGSSSIKFATYAIDKKIEKINDGSIENIKTAPVFKICDKDKNQIFNEQYTAEHDYDFFYELLLLKLKQANHNVIAVGHRVVHGGKAYHEPVIVSNKIVGELKALEPFAPLHQPFNVAALEIIANKHPELFQVACFDTAFHYTIPPVASHFGLPRHLTDEGVRRYGFHGLSYEYIMSRLKEISPALYDKRVIVAHLGNGASLCAIKQGKSLASTMGFSTLDGLLMGTRCGVIDPGVLLYLMQFKKMGHAAIEELLYKQSGLLGVSGISNNMQVLEQNESPAARDAIELFVYRIQREMGFFGERLGRA